MHVCAKYIHATCDDDDDEEEEWVDIVDGEEDTQQAESATSSYLPAFMTRKYFILGFLIATNVPLALYTSLIHQRGTVDVMRYLHRETLERGNKDMNVLFLMPCHSTPWYG